jgi:hypothetical protein
VRPRRAHARYSGAGAHAAARHIATGDSYFHAFDDLLNDDSFLPRNASALGFTGLQQDGFAPSGSLVVAFDSAPLAPAAVRFFCAAVCACAYANVWLRRRRSRSAALGSAAAR